MSIYKKIGGVAGGLAVVIGIAAGVLELVVGVKTLWPDRGEDVVVIQDANIVPDIQPQVHSGDYGNVGTVTRLWGGTSLEKLRDRNAVRTLRATEEDAMLSTLPNGVYGYVGDSLVRIHLELDRVDEMKLMKSKKSSSYVEIHKTALGDILVIVYATEGDVTRLEDPTRKEAMEMFVLYRSDGEYKHLVAIPTSRLLTWDDRNGEELGYFARIRVQ